MMFALLAALALTSADLPPEGQALSESAEPQPSPAAPARVLTLQDAVREALSVRPSLRQARAQVRSAQARADQARSGLLPQVAANLGYQRSTANFTARPGAVPSQVAAARGRSSFETFDYFSGGANLSQQVWDFGATSGRWRAARESAEAQRASEKSVQQQVVYEVQAAYFAALGARGLVRVADETLENRRRHLERIRAFVEVGSRPRIDLVQAQADLASAEVQRIEAENGYQTARVQLNQAIGRDGMPDFELSEEEVAPVPGEDSALATLLEEALRARPEMAEIDRQIRAQELQVASLRGAYYPSLDVGTGVTYGGPDLGGLGWNWTAQATLTVPIYLGGLTRAQVAEGQSALESLRAQRDAVRQQVASEVDSARLAVQAARAALAAAERSLTYARERLQLAEGRYQAGAGSAIELADAQLALTSAAIDQVRAEYGLAAARAQLRRALGRPFGP